MDVTEDVESPLLQGVGEVDEGAAGPRIGDQKQDLRPPKLHVSLPGIQQEEVFPDLF